MKPYSNHTSAAREVESMKDVLRFRRQQQNLVARLSRSLSIVLCVVTSGAAALFGPRADAAGLSGRFVAKVEVADETGRLRQEIRGVPGVLICLLGEQPKYEAPPKPPPPVKISVGVVRFPKAVVVVPGQKILFDNRGPDTERVIFQGDESELDPQGSCTLPPGFSHRTSFKTTSVRPLIVKDDNFEREIKIVCSPPGCACVSDADGKFRLSGWKPGKKSFEVWHPDFRSDPLADGERTIDLDFKLDQEIDLKDVEIFP